jgi:hypothetical protein
MLDAGQLGADRLGQFARCRQKRLDLFVCRGTARIGLVGVEGVRQRDTTFQFLGQ